MGLTLENEDGRPLSECQIIKRMAYRDTISTFDYLKDRQAFERRMVNVFLMIALQVRL